MSTPANKRHAEIGARLREERERLGYTEKQIAQLLSAPLENYARFESGQEDPGLFRVARLQSCGFDLLYVMTGERRLAIAEESELLVRFRELSQRGRATIFSTLDALERLAPNLRQEIKKRFKR